MSQWPVPEGIALCRQLQAAASDALAAVREVERFGSITAFFHPSDPLIFLNYAVVDAEPTAAELDEMQRSFAARHRRPRFEYFPAFAPQLESKLVNRGWNVELRSPVMAHNLELGGRYDGEAELTEDVETLIAAQLCAGVAFGHEEPENRGAAERSAAQIREGRLLVATISRDDQIVCVASLLGAGSIAELAGVGARPEYRRRGFAGSCCRLLLEAHQRRGGETVWLSAGSEGAVNLYEALGFRQVGLQLHVSAP